MKSPAQDIELDLGRYELRRLGRRVKLQKQAMELLILLVRRREQLVSREDIVGRLWRSKLFVDTDAAINNLVRKLRTALHDDPAKPRFLETVVGKGYRFIGPVRVIGQLPRSDSHPAEQAESTVWTQRSSLAVVPLLLLGTETSDEGIGLGFADALVSRLGNIPSIDVLPLSAVWNLAETPAPDIAARLGIRFVVHGAIRRMKGRWHIGVEMFDADLHGPCFTRTRELEVGRLPEVEDEIAGQLARTLNCPIPIPARQAQQRYSRDRLAYSEFMAGYRLSSSADPTSLEKAVEHLANAVTRDPAFSLAHATLSLACATRHYEFDPSSVWLDKAEFHCQRALELDPELPEAHVAKAFLLWGPSKNFQHLEAIAELKRALALQSNLPHAYNRLGTILAHVGLLDAAREMYERARPFHPKRAVSHSIVQVYLWNREYDSAQAELQAWRDENPRNKYAIYFAPQPAMMIEDWKRAESLLDEAAQALPDEPLILSLQGLYSALTGDPDHAHQCLTRALERPQSFGHSHHVYYQIACILALLGQTKDAFAWLERSVNTGFACWPFFLKDRCLQSLRLLPEFELLVSSIRARYPDDLGFVGKLAAR